MLFADMPILVVTQIPIPVEVQIPMVALTPTARTVAVRIPMVALTPTARTEITAIEEALVMVTILKVQVRVRIIWINSCSPALQQEALCNIGASRARLKLRM